MKKALPVIITALVLIVALVYFFGYNHSNPSYGTNSTSTSKTGTTSSQSQDTNQQQSQAVNKVTIQDMAFSPANITVKKGTTVTWTNQDSIGHTVFETDGQPGPHSSTLGKGQTYTFTYTTVGTFKYDCSIHPNMTGSVAVTE